MRVIPAAELPDIWEHGERQHPLDRAISLLAAAFPEKEREELVQLSIGQRDALLFTLRQMTFGPQMEAYAECPACSAQFEFKINIKDLLREYNSPVSEEQSVKLNRFNISFRLPNSLDIAACINAGSDEVARGLLQRCILKVTRNKKPVALNDIPETIVSDLEALMEKADPLADIQIALRCSECNQHWKMQLDALGFLWDELGTQVKQLLYQVHILSRAYGWREADILAMNNWRRHFYLEMVT